MRALFPLFKKPLYFVHIPKCAGTSLIDLLDSIFIKEEIFPLHYEIPYLLKMSPSKVRSFAFYRGHIPYDLLMEKLTFQEVDLLVLLRRPVERLLSNFEMRQRVPDPLDNLQHVLAQMKFETFLESSIYQRKFRHRATELLGGIKDDNRQYPCLSRAIERLKKAKVVGLTERFEESLLLMAWKFGWPPLRYSRRKNVSPGREGRAGVLNEALKQRVRELEWADERLYEEGRGRFERDWAAFERYRGEVGEGWWRRRMLEEMGEDGGSAVGVMYDLRRVYPGQGWYAGERHEVYGHIRWSGPERRSYLYVYIEPRRRVRMVIRVVGWLKEEVRESLVVRVNGEAVRVVKREGDRGGEEIEVVIKGEVLKGDGIQEIEFEVGETVSPKEMGAGGDERKLGLAYQWIAVFAG